MTKLYYQEFQKQMAADQARKLRFKYYRYYINDNLIMYLSKVGEPSPDDGGGSPSYFV